jgi:hypothetical protein
MDCKAAGNTVSEAVFEVIDPEDTRMPVEPVPVLVANPLRLIVATEGTVENQVTPLVTF